MSPSFIDLHPAFLKIVEPGKRYQVVRSLHNADGVRFLCPACYRKNGGSHGTHSVICWFKHVDRSESPGPGRWNVSGDRFDNLTLSPSVKIDCWHGFIRNGDVS